MSLGTGIPHLDGKNPNFVPQITDSENNIEAKSRNCLCRSISQHKGKLAIAAAVVAFLAAGALSCYLGAHCHPNTAFGQHVLKWGNATLVNKACAWHAAALTEGLALVALGIYVGVRSKTACAVKAEAKQAMETRRELEAYVDKNL